MGLQKSDRPLVQQVLSEMGLGRTLLHASENTVELTMGILRLLSRVSMEGWLCYLKSQLIVLFSSPGVVMSLRLVGSDYSSVSIWSASTAREGQDSQRRLGDHKFGIDRSQDKLMEANDSSCILFICSESTNGGNA